MDENKTPAEADITGISRKISVLTEVNHWDTAEICVSQKTSLIGCSWGGKFLVVPLTITIL